MFRTTKPRTRALLSLPVAFAAAAAISVPLVGVASATHTTQLTIAPNPGSSSVGTCFPYTVNLVDANGAGISGAVVDVQVTEQAPTAAQDIDFCTTPSGAKQPQAPSDQSVDPNPNNVAGAGTVDRAEFTTNSTGEFVFGIIGTDSGTAGILVFYEDPATSNDDVFDSVNASEESAATTHTFTAGSVPGNPAATAGNVQCVDATPETDTQVVNQPQTINVRVTNNSPASNPAGTGGTVTNPPGACGGDPIAGVTPVFNIAGPNADGITRTCTTTNNAGEATCTYTGSAAGTDTVTVFVNKTGGGAGTIDGGEPSDSVAREYLAQFKTGLVVDLTCTAAPAAGADPDGGGPLTGQSNQTTAEDCIVEDMGGTTSQTFTATVTKPDTAIDVDTLRDPVGGELVRFTENGASSSVSPTECTTSSVPGPGFGSCSVTLTETTAVGGEVITVTSRIVSQNPNEAGSMDSGTLTIANETTTQARELVLLPAALNSQTATVQTLTAHVVDKRGNAVRNVPVTFTSTGVGRFTDGSGPITRYTNALGEATIQVTTLANETGQQTVTATIPSASTECGTAVNVPNPGDRQGDCTDATTITYTTSSPTSQPTATASASPSVSTSPSASPSVSTSPSSGCAVGNPANVTLQSNVTQITAGNAPTLSGVVTNGAGQACAGVSITIFKKGYGEAGYTALATVSTDAQGRFTLVVRPLVQTAYGANTGNNVVRSNVLVVRVYTRVNLTTPATPQPANTARQVSNPVTFTGSLLPGYGNVAVGLGTFVNGRFVVLQQTVTNSAGGYSLTRTLRPGTGVYVVFTSAHQGTDKGAKSITLLVS